MQAQSGPLKGLNPTVTLIAAFVVMAFVIFGAVATETAGGVFTAVKDAIIGGLKWYYIGIVAFFLFFSRKPMMLFGLSGIVTAGLGVVEGTITAVLTLFKVPASLGGAVTILDRLINFWSIVVFGFILYLVSKRK